MRLAGLCGCVSKVFAVEIARWTDKCAEKSKNPLQMSAPVRISCVSSLESEV